MRQSSSLLILLSLSMGLAVAQTSSPATTSSTSKTDSAPASGGLTSEQDHQRVLDLLHIKELRPAAEHDTKSPNAANYDEAKAGTFVLPDPLRLKNGGKVTTPEVWWKQRRPEIVEDFSREVYGRAPGHTPAVRWELVKTARETQNGTEVVTKTLLGHVDNSSHPAITVDLQLTLTLPGHAAGSVPVIVEFGMSPEILAMFAKRYPDAMKNNAGPTPMQQILALGWGHASLVATSIQDDDGAGLTRGIIGLVNKGQPRKLDDWGVLRAWGWGASRTLDYLESDKDVDARRVGITGHSRYGKAALVAMADDSRFAIGFITSPGAGGAALYRRHFGELTENLAASKEYHWMAGNFLKYAGPLAPKDLPVDSHELIALCAPRPVFISSGSMDGDGWLDPKGMFLAEAAAGPVYELLGKKGLGTSEFPAPLTALTSGDLAFRQHTEGHVAGPNWPVFLEFAQRYFSPVGRVSGK